MGDLLKVIVKLNVSGDGRTSDNYKSYRVQLTNTLAGKEVQGIPLHLVLTNRGPGAKPTDPGPSEGAWIAAAPANEPRDAAAYKAASDAYFMGHNQQSCPFLHHGHSAWCPARGMCSARDCS